MRLELIETVTIGNTPLAQVSFNVSGISSNYVDLYLYISARTNQTIPYFWESIQLGFNNYSGTWRGITQARNNSTPYGAVDDSGLTYSAWAGMYAPSNASANTFGISTIYIPDWRANHHKPVMLDSAAPQINYGAQQMGGSRWLSSNAITSIQVRPGGSHSFVENSIISLYGVTSASGGITVS